MMAHIYMFSARVQIEFFERLIALVLSQKIPVVSKLITKSLSVFLIHNIWVQHNLAAIYFTSIVERPTQFCFLLN